MATDAPAPVINRWFIPVGAVAVHICIGSVYAWSTFNRPMAELFKDVGWFNPTYATYSTALVLLGLSAAFGGPWVERRGPRVAATAAALFFGALNGIAAATLLAPAVAHAQEKTADNWPNRPIRAILPIAPGTGSDVIAPRRVRLYLKIVRVCVSTMSIPHSMCRLRGAFEMDRLFESGINTQAFCVFRWDNPS